MNQLLKEKAIPLPDILDEKPSPDELSNSGTFFPEGDVSLGSCYDAQIKVLASALNKLPAFDGDTRCFATLADPLLGRYKSAVELSYPSGKTTTRHFC